MIGQLWPLIRDVYYFRVARHPGLTVRDDTKTTPKVRRVTSHLRQSGPAMGASSTTKSPCNSHPIPCTIQVFSMTSELTDAQRRVWLFLNERSGHGEPSPTYREICKHFGFASPKAAFDHVTALEKKGYVARGTGARNLRLVRKLTGIPLLARIPAGFAEEALTTNEVRINLDPEFYGIRDRSRAFALRVTGDSMAGRHIFDGDIVLLDDPADVRDGDIVAALIDNQSTLKTLVHKGGKVWLRAENPDYPDLIPLMDLQVQGVVRAVIRQLKR